MDLNEFTALFGKMMGQMGAAPQMQQQQQFQAFWQGGMGMNPMMGMIGQGTMMGNPSLGGANGMGSPSMMYAMPGKGFVSPNFPGAFSIYPAPGSRPMSAQSPYSMYSFGGYDSYGFPLAHPGVPSSTPPPPVPPEAGAAAR